MRARVLAFVQDLRSRGIGASVAETLDAVAAVATAGIERPVLREALAATLVKDERDRAAFDVLFDEAFPLVGAPEAPGRRKRRRAGGAPAEPGGTAAATAKGRAAGRRSLDPRDARTTPGAARSRRPRSRRAAGRALLRSRARASCWRCPSTNSVAAT